MLKRLNSRKTQKDRTRLAASVLEVSNSRIRSLGMNSIYSKLNVIPQTHSSINTISIIILSPHSQSCWCPSRHPSPDPPYLLGSPRLRNLGCHRSSQSIPFLPIFPLLAPNDSQMPSTYSPAEPLFSSTCQCFG